MPTRTIVPTALRLTLSNSGRDLDTKVAVSGEHAIKVAVLMIASRDVLHHGDQLTVRFAEDGQDMNMPRGPRP